MRGGRVTIVGQGLAGTLLGWACERAGVDFEVVDEGSAASASAVGAGIINPVTGRRWVPTWGIGGEREGALAVYRELEHVLAVRLVRAMRVRRLWRDATERAAVRARVEAGELAPWVEPAGLDGDGAWIEGAAQVDTEGLLAAMRARWRVTGRWREARRDDAEAAEGEVVIWCVGEGAAVAFGHVPWEWAKGQIVRGRVAGGAAWAEDVILNAGEWVLPWGGGEVRVGATYERGRRDREVTAEARERLCAAAERITGGRLEVTGQEAAVRVTTPDRRPVAGWHPRRAGVGVLGGLASKGALWAPGLARRWVEQLVDGRAWAAEVDAARFAGRFRD